jgi:hypothetical protein
MNKQGNSDYRMDQGVINYDFTFKPHSSSVKKLVKGIAGTTYLFSTIDLSSIAAFNISTQKPQESLEETLNANNVNVTMKTSDGALGFVIVEDNYLTLYSTSKAIFTFENVTLDKFGYNGIYDSLGSFINQNKVYPVGNSYVSSGEEIVRIKINR